MDTKPSVLPDEYRMGAFTCQGNLNVRGDLITELVRRLQAGNRIYKSNTVLGECSGCGLLSVSGRRNKSCPVALQPEVVHRDCRFKMESG